MGHRDPRGHLQHANATDRASGGKTQAGAESLRSSGRADNGNVRILPVFIHRRLF